MEKKKRRYFPDEFKRQAAERVETSGLSIMDVAAELGVHETQLRRWTREFGRSGTGPARRPNTQAQGPSPAELAAENARLKRELQKAQTERDILKMAALIDMHTRKVVGWSMRETLHASIALEALDMAIRRQRPAPGFAIGLERMATRWLTPAFGSRHSIRS